MFKIGSKIFSLQWHFKPAEILGICGRTELVTPFIQHAIQKDMRSFVCSSGIKINYLTFGYFLLTYVNKCKVTHLNLAFTQLHRPENSRLQEPSRDVIQLWKRLKLLINSDAIFNRGALYSNQSKEHHVKSTMPLWSKESTNQQKHYTVHVFFIKMGCLSLFSNMTLRISYILF